MKNTNNDFLRYAGFFAPDLPLPMATIANLMDEPEAELTHKLADAGILLELPIGMILTVLPENLPQAALIDAQHVADTVTRQLEKAFRNHNKVKQLAAFRPIGPHLVTLIEKLEPFALQTRWKLYSLMGQYLMLVGKAEAACEYFSQAARRYPEPYEPDDDELNTLTLQTADAETARGNYDLAAVLVKRVIEHEVEANALPRPLTLVKLANIMYRGADYAQAIVLYRQAIQLEQDSSGDDNLAASHWNNLGRVYLTAEQNEAAIEAFLHAADLWSKTQATEHHINRSLALKNLALAYQAQQDFTRAQRSIEEAIQLSEAEYGVDHPDIGRDANIYALILQAQGEFEAALQQFRRALRIDTHSFGQLHPEVALTLNNMGALYARMGEIEKARQSFYDARDILLRCSNEDHPYWRQVQENIAGVDQP